MMRFKPKTSQDTYAQNWITRIIEDIPVRHADYMLQSIYDLLRTLKNHNHTVTLPHRSMHIRTLYA